MVDFNNPPKSPTLFPPRKSVELEDSGAHDLEASENEEEEEFANASEGQENTRPASPIPMTRVEKVDNRDDYGEVPGTPAYRLREQDAVPDELEIVPDDSTARSDKRSRPSRSPSPGGSPIPKTVVEKVDPSSSSHGDKPGTVGYSRRKADAVPDVITQAAEPDAPNNKGDQGGNIQPEIPVPTTMITKVDSAPSHGEVPGTDAYDLRQGDARPDKVEKKGDVSDLPTTSRSKPSKAKQRKPPIDGAYPIAADGGFGPMDESDDSEEEDTILEHDDDDNDTERDGDKGFGDDFDDFEAGAEDEDFGDFDEAFQQSPEVEEAPSARTEPSAPPIQSLPPQESPFPLVDFSDLDTRDDIIIATDPYLNELFPTTMEEYPPPPALAPSSTSNSIFLTDRSLSLWSQLVAPPPLQPPNWVRSRIRRLFLVSLGVPVDLDEILPASKQKKLVLPSIHLRSGSQSPPEGKRTASRVRLKQENVSSTSIDQPSSSTKNRKRKGPPSAPELDLQSTKMLCATTEAALSNMTEEELQAHVKKLEELTARASEVLEYWLKRRDSALGDKEAFEGVIENLVKHARRVRK